MKKIKNMKLFYFIVILLICVGMIKIIGDKIYKSDWTSHEYISPDQKYTLMVEEKPVWFNGKGEFYQKLKNGSYVYLGEYSSDDGYKPFEAGTYSITWENNIVIVKYGYKGGTIDREIILTFQESE